MPVFEYTALNLKGRPTKGVIDADNLQTARNRLRDRQLYPTQIQEVEAGAAESGRFAAHFFSRVSQKEISLVTRQLATLTGAGFPLVGALHSVIGQGSKPALKRTLSRVKDAVEGGASFADALAAESGTFSPIYINMVRSGESSGTLEVVLERLADLLENQQALKSRVRSAMAYPLLMTIFGGLVLLALMTLIVPGLVSIFEDMHQTLPLPTRILLSTSDFLKSWWWALLLGIGALPSVFGFLRRSERFGMGVDRILLTLPIVGTLTAKLAVTRCCRTLGSLLENGVSILSALSIVENLLGNRVLEKTVADASIAVERGDGLAASLAAGRGFPDMALQMIQVGERSGTLETMLQKVADIYENETQSTVSALTALLEPLVILVMGLAVGLIVLAICLPIFEMNQLIK